MRIRTATVTTVLLLAALTACGGGGKDAAGKAPAALDDLSTIIEGATNAGEASSTLFENGSEPLEGRLAPGVSAVKTDDNSIESKYGKKIVVTVQRNSDDFSLDFPEFTGEITD